MARTVKEWIGKTDDARPPKGCRRRIVDRQNGLCALSGEPFTPKDKIEFDHITPLWLGGENRESNLQAVKGVPHQRKTAVEAGVRAKVYAARDRHLGIKTPPARPLQSRGWPKRERAPRPMPILPPLPPRDIYARPLLTPIGSLDRPGRGDESE